MEATQPSRLTSHALVSIETTAIESRIHIKLLIGFSDNRRILPCRQYWMAHASFLQRVETKFLKCL